MIEVITAKENHASDIATIGVLSFYDAFSSLFESLDNLNRYLNYTYDVEKIRRSIAKKNNIYFVAILNGKVVGFAKVKKNSVNEQLKPGTQIELQKIYVLTEFQGTGAGAALMAAVKDLGNFLHAEHIWLDTHIANYKAIRLYEKNGFKIIGKHNYTIGLQTFDFHLMGLEMAVEMPKAS